jgi:hypothetical protein
MATLWNLALSLLYLSGVTEITRTLQAIARDRTRILDYLPHETHISNDSAGPVTGGLQR